MRHSNMNSTLPSLDDDLEYVLFKNELEEQRREKEQSSKLFSLRSVIIILSLFSSIALITVLTLLATSATVPEIAPLAAYDIKSDTFSPRTFPNIEQLMEEKPASQKELSAEVKNRILSKMDTKVKPCDDFYSHVCGAWEKEYTLLSGEHSHTDSFDSIMRRTVQQQFHTLFSKFDFISPFYKSCMNPDDVDASGDAQLAPIMALIDSVQDADSFFDVLGQLHRGNFASDVLFQTELFPLNADQIPGIDAVERTYSVLVQPVISRVSSHYSSLPKLLKVMNLADDKHAKSLASEITRVVSDITKIMSKSEDGEEVANCAPTTLMEDESVGNFGRMFIMYNKGMGNGSLYNQKARSHLMTSRHCYWVGGNIMGGKLADYFYSQVNSEVNLWRDFLKVSVVATKLNLLPKKYADAWGRNDYPGPVTPAVTLSMLHESREDGSSDDEACHPIKRTLQFDPTASEDEDNLPNVCLTAKEQVDLQQFFLTMQASNVDLTEVISKKAQAHLVFDNKVETASMFSSSASFNLAMLRSPSPALIAVKWLTLSNKQMASKWMSLPKDVRSELWKKMNSVQRSVCKDAEFKQRAEERRQQYNPHPIVDDSMLKKRFDQMYSAEALKASSDAQRQWECKEFTIKTFNNLFAHDWVLDSFPKENLEVAQELVDMIYNQMAKHIKKADWLDEQTITRALEKWSKMAKNVAFDSDWQEAPEIELTGHMFMDAAIVFAEQKARGYEMLDQPVDRFKFPFAPGQMDMGMDYFTPNAFYFPLSNSINMLAGLMAEPLFSADMPMQLNLASYGYIIGHEITHGFDDNGRKYDGEGLEKDWWTKKATENFNSHAQCLVDQFNSFRYYLLFHVRGQQTLGENIADLGGLSVAWDTFNEYEQKYNPQGTRIMEEYSNQELFWIYAGQSWCGKSDFLGTLTQLAMDPHSPGKCRVNGPMSNLKGFADTFQCKPKSVMGRSLTDKACSLW